MSKSRRTFLKTAAGVAAGAALGPEALLAQAKALARVSGSRAPTRIAPELVITPDEALAWNTFKAQAGPTYAGSAGWKRFTDFLIAKLQENGAVDFDYVDIPYDHYIVEDWPDRRTHVSSSPTAVEKLYSDGTPVPVVASYGMTSGSTPREGVTAPMVFYDESNPPPAASLAGKILVFQTTPYPEPPYAQGFIDSYTHTDYLWRSPGKWPPLFVPPPTSATSSFHSRWVWNQLGRFARVGMTNKAAGMVIVYDLSPGAAFGLAQRSVYTPDGRAGLGAEYTNCPTLTLDRVNGAKVIADAKAGKTGALTLIARFQRDSGRAIIAYLPGKDYGTPRDQQVLLGTHTDAMSLIEENGGLGIAGMFSYWNKIPKAQRDRTLVAYCDCRHFMPGGEGSWPEYDYYEPHPERLAKIVATIGVEHMGGRQTIETGPGGNDYRYSSEKPEDGGVITSFMDVNNNNIWLVESIARAATDNHWPRVDVKSGDVEPGVNGGYQARVRSPMNKGRSYERPGVGLAGDWPGAWTQTYAQVDGEAGPAGFDKNYFVAQVAGLSQIAGDMMKVRPIVIDLGWGDLKSAIVSLADTAFTAPAEAATQRKALVDQYVATFRQVEAGSDANARTALQALSARVATAVVPDQRTKVAELVEAQRAKLG